MKNCRYMRKFSMISKSATAFRTIWRRENFNHECPLYSFVGIFLVWFCSFYVHITYKSTYTRDLLTAPLAFFASKLLMLVFPLFFCHFSFYDLFKQSFKCISNHLICKTNSLCRYHQPCRRFVLDVVNKCVLLLFCHLNSLNGTLESTRSHFVFFFFCKLCLSICFPFILCKQPQPLEAPSHLQKYIFHFKPFVDIFP